MAFSATKAGVFSPLSSLFTPSRSCKLTISSSVAGQILEISQTLISNPAQVKSAQILPVSSDSIFAECRGTVHGPLWSLGYHHHGAVVAG